MKQLLILLFLPFFGRAQHLPSVTLDLSDVDIAPSLTIPFSAVQVMDVRFDRSNIGCISDITRANASRIKHVQALASFPDSLHRYLPLLLQRMVQLQPASNDTLVLLIKQFRVTDRLFNSLNRQLEPEILLRLSLSAFSRHHNQLKRIFSYDNLLLEKIPDDRILKPDVFRCLRNELMALMLQKALAGQSWQSQGPAFSVTAVEDGIRKRFQLPLFTDSLLRPGVYKTFQEFKRNAPSLTNVQFDMKKTG